MSEDDKARVVYHGHQVGNWTFAALNAPSTAKAILCMGHASFHRSEAKRLAHEEGRQA